MESKHESRGAGCLQASRADGHPLNQSAVIMRSAVCLNTPADRVNGDLCFQARVQVHCPRRTVAVKESGGTFTIT